MPSTSRYILAALFCTGLASIGSTFAAHGATDEENGVPGYEQPGPIVNAAEGQDYIRLAGNGAFTDFKIGKAGQLMIIKPNSFGGLQVTGLEIARNNVPLAGNGNFLSGSSICQYWTSNLDRLNGAFKDMVRSTVNPRMGGFTIRSDARSQLTQNCGARAEVLMACDNKVAVRIALPGNRFLFHVTTPSVIGGWADPEFSVDFDLEARTQISIPANVTSPMGVGKTTIAVSNIRLNAQNVSGKLALAVQKVHQYFTGNDLTQQLTQDRQFNFAGIQQPVADLNPWLRKIPSDHRIEACINNNVLRLNAVNGPEDPGPIVK
ncbi:hypothetical protein M2281_004255 [Mesorhizobium soli]|jgi:hypothetical protein|uniref:hypothetical protein n=1 Tax=Pseudaminobacter soli (ex Li et al. 2025) TaxID=1295366 RepID=UPI002473AC88|nr:hypothetical protein [Mesorhizobium soli]MDH6233644.1 hypothetical protein [Mesorhizobium soli]